MRNHLLCAAILAVLMCAGIVAQAQDDCQPPVLARTNARNIFTGDLETALGDVSAEHISGLLRVIEDDTLTGHLRRIGERLLKHMPPNDIRFRFFVIDSSQTNAFAVAGGRIYITRKLIAMTRSEDELAGVVAHEMGHQLAHHGGISFTRDFRRVLNITEVRDRADVIDKYHQLIDNYMRKPEYLTQQKVDEMEDEQVAADQVSVYAAAQAGYTPTAMVTFMDRLMETKGKTGNLLTVLFGGNSRESERLGRLIRNMKALPAGCIEVGGRSSPEEFREWQAKVVTYAGFGKQEALPNVSTRKVLSPPLREEIQHVRFSPDGKYLLAQDSASIYVLTKEPFAPLFRIAAYEAYPAQFTPDSKGIVFHDRRLRVEKWNIARKQLEERNEIFGRKRCMPGVLSPDGKFLACVHFEQVPDIEVNLTVFEVSTSEAVYFRKQFLSWFTSDWNFLPLYLRILSLVGEETPLGKVAFSPDGRYVVAASGQTKVALDLATKKEISLPGSIKSLLDHSFAFLSDGRLAGMAGSQGTKSAVVRFPTGEVLSSGIEIGGSAVSGGTRGDYLTLRPLNAAAAGLMNLKTKKIEVVSMVEAIDSYDNLYVSERRNGELALYSQTMDQPLAVAQLPSGPLGRLRTASASPDLQMLALSTDERGAVWNLASNRRLLYVRGFRGLHFASDAVYANFPPERFPRPAPGEKPLTPQERRKRGNALARLDVTAGQVTGAKEYGGETTVRQVGPYLVLTPREPDKDDSDEKPQKLRSVKLEIADATSGAVLWSKEMERMPLLRISAEAPESMLLIFRLNEDAAKDYIKDDLELKRTVDGIQLRERSYLAVVLQTRSGKVLAKFPVDTGEGSFRLADGIAAGNRVVFTDSENRVLVYSLDGERTGEVFGGGPIVSHDGRLLCIEREPGRLTLYELPSMRLRDEFTFGTRVAYAAFGEDSKRMLVLTDDQTFFLFQVPTG